MVQVLSVIRALYPLMLLVGSAYQYGVKKYGSGAWKDDDVSTHLDKAVEHLTAWKRGENEPSDLVDGCLRLMFATYLAASGTLTSKKYVEAKLEKEQ